MSMWLFAVAACFWIANTLLDRNITVGLRKEPVESVSQEERRLKALRRVRIIARGMFEAGAGEWIGANYGVFVRIAPDQPGIDVFDVFDGPTYSYVEFMLIGKEWHILSVNNQEKFDLDYLESFDKIDNPWS